MPPKSKTAKGKTPKKTHSPGGTSPKRAAEVDRYREEDANNLVSEEESRKLADRVKNERERLRKIYPENYGGSKTGKRKSRRNKNKTQRRK